MIYLDYIKEEDIGKVCLCCMGHFENLKTIKIKPLSYGSLFDAWGTTVYLCENCYNQSPKPLRNLCTVDDFELSQMGFSCKQYKKEGEILAYLESLPIAARELIFNRNKIDILFPEKPINPIDWIETEKALKDRENNKLDVIGTENEDLR